MVQCISLCHIFPAFLACSVMNNHWKYQMRLIWQVEWSKSMAVIIMVLPATNYRLNNKNPHGCLLFEGTCVVSKFWGEEKKYINQGSLYAYAHVLTCIQLNHVRLVCLKLLNGVLGSTSLTQQINVVITMNLQLIHRLHQKQSVDTPEVWCNQCTIKIWCEEK